MPEPDLTLLSSTLDQLAPYGRSALLPALHAAQDQYGYISESVAVEIGRRLEISLADVTDVINFYPMFYSEPVGKTVIHICNDPVCANAGAGAFMKMLSQHIEEKRINGEPIGTVTIEQAPCLGLCEHAPAITFQGTPVAKADTHTYEDLVAGKLRHPRSIVRSEISILTANCGKGRVNWMNFYDAGGGYKAFRKTLGLSPAQVIAEVKASGLLGRGGAAFSTGEKWAAAAQASGSHKYIICNAEEAEPGAFKDRVLLEDDPHRIIEGMLIAGYAIGAEKGYVFIRGEYLFQFDVMRRAVEEARRAGYLGKRILESDFNFEIEVRRGAGSYVLGEETALLEAIEGKRAYPRLKPPFPSAQGLFGSPTVINNVETLVNIPYILNVGAQEYRRIGTEKSTGSKLFCLSGDVAMPGLYEVPFGITFRHLLEDLAGGVRSGHRLQGALFGGAAGIFATPNDLDVRLTFEDLEAAGLTLGAGVITVFDETRDLRLVCLRLAQFFAKESCGKCAPCQMGAKRQAEIIQRMIDKHTLPGDLEQLHNTTWTRPDASICGLGQFASSAVLSAVRNWPFLFR
jgi:NADH-quinone oxidoreductase subunit F